MVSRAFTLLEVLIVVLIVGILMAVAIPNWLQARTTARTNVCEANIQKIEEAKQRWIMDKGLEPDAHPAYSDLEPEFIRKIPNTPTGNKFVLGDGLTRATGDGCLQ